MASETKGLERWNTHFSTVVEQPVLGVTLRLAQDPNSEHLGTTVWDASIVLAKFFEKNIRKGEFSRPKVSHKKAIELGAGIGLAGLAFAMIGADVLLTDVKEVLPLLQRNYENNLSRAALRAAGQESHLCSCGSVSVAELDWSQPQQYAALPGAPFDFVLAADCIYHETLVRHLYRAMLAITNERTTIVVANERRSESVQAAFTSLFSPSFSFKKVPLAKQDPDYSHPAIEIYLLKRRKTASDANLVMMEQQEAEQQEAEEQQQQGGEQQQEERQEVAAAGGEAAAIQEQLQQLAVGEQQQQQQQDDDGVPEAAPQQQQSPQTQTEQQQAAVAGDGGVAWGTRRQGSEAARLLAGVAVPSQPPAS